LKAINFVFDSVRFLKLIGIYNINMRTKFLVFSLVVSAFSLVLLSSCGHDDNIVNNNNNNGVLFMRDSISLFTGASNQTGTDSAVYSANLSNVGSVKVEFAIETNADSTNGRSRSDFYVSSSSNSFLPYDTVFYSAAANSYLYNLNVSSNPFSVTFHLGLTTGTITTPAYIRFKNIKITSQ